MRISDWSSDVCSSDLWHDRPGPCGLVHTVRLLREQFRPGFSRLAAGDMREHRGVEVCGDRCGDRAEIGRGLLEPPVEETEYPTLPQRHGLIRPRSEEHTSELQSLMRRSYAVFCLKKKTRRLT